MTIHRSDTGHSRSARTQEETRELLQKELDGLTPGEREALEIAMAQVLSGTEIPELYETIDELEWVQKPVPLDKFVNDPYYLGNTCDTLYAQLLEDLKELFKDGTYREAIFTGSIGWGKTFAASIGVCYMLHQLGCMRDPHRSFGIAANSNISVVCLSVNEVLATKVAYENIATKIEASPWFQEHFPFKKTKKELRFPRHIWVAARATTDSSVLGLNVIGGLLDETNFMAKSKGSDPRFNLDGQAQVLYNAMQRRMKSRFERKGQLPGMLFVVSSKQTADDFTAKRIRDSAGDPTIFVRDYCLTGDTVVPLLDGTEVTLRELADRYGASGERFEVYSFDVAAGRVVPGRAYRPRLTARNEEILRVELDNGEVVKATPWHPFMLKSGEFKRADELSPGDSLMPLYRRPDKKGYEEVGQPWWGGRWQKTHHMAARDRYGEWPKRGSDGKPVVIHHENFNKRDNRTANLTPMEWTDHVQVHSKNMGLLLDYVRGDAHRAWASEHMSGLHKDPEFSRARDERGAAHFRKLWDDPDFREKASKAAGERLSRFHSTSRGRVRQTERSLKYWDKIGRKTDLGRIFAAAESGLSIIALADELGCTPAAVSQRLKRAGEPTYGKLKQQNGHFSPGNHKVVSVTPGAREDVYDLSVEGLENFAIGAGVFVHNSLWDVKPPEYYAGDWFHVIVGSDSTPSRILKEEEDPEAAKDTLSEGCILLPVPEEYRMDFERDLDGAVRDLAGVATVAVSPYISRRQKIEEAINYKRQHPFTSESWDPSQPGRFKWEKMVALRAERDFGDTFSTMNRPIINPSAARHIHIDPSLTGDCTGFVMGHIAGFTEVVRRGEEGGRFAERAPMLCLDVALRIVPPLGDEIQLGDLRRLIYQLTEKGYVITRVTMDSWQSAEAIQKLQQKGYNAEVLSVDRTMSPYEVLKEALYDGRLELYDYPPLIRELRELEHDRVKRKVDHPARGSKDVADALAGICYSLTENSLNQPMPFVRSTPMYSGDAWMQEQIQHSMASAARRDMETSGEGALDGGLLPAFLVGSGGGSNWEE